MVLNAKFLKRFHEATAHILKNVLEYYTYYEYFYTQKDTFNLCSQTRYRQDLNTHLGDW